MKESDISRLYLLQSSHLVCSSMPLSRFIVFFFISVLEWALAELKRYTTLMVYLAVGQEEEWIAKTDLFPPNQPRQTIKGKIIKEGESKVQPTVHSVVMLRKQVTGLLGVYVWVSDSIVATCYVVDSVLIHSWQCSHIFSTILLGFSPSGSWGPCSWADGPDEDH